MKDRTDKDNHILLDWFIHRFYPQIEIWKKRWIRSSTLTCQIIVQQILIFLGAKNTYTTLLGPTRLLISDIFPSKPDFHLYKWGKILPTQPYYELHIY